MNRPLVWVAAPFVVGIALSGLSHPFVTALAVFLAAAGAIILWLSGTSELLVRLGCLLLFGASGFLYAELRVTDATSDPLLELAMKHPDQEFTLAGYVERPDTVLEDSGYAQFWLRSDTLQARDGSPQDARGLRVLVRWYNPTGPLYPGDRVRVVGELEHALSAINPGVSSYEDYLRRHDVHTATRVQGDGEVELIQRGSMWSPTHLAGRFRQAQAERLSRVLPEHVVPFVMTVWLGERRLIDATKYAEFVQSGTAHILAVSGVHTGIVYLTAAFFLGMFLPGYDRRRLRGVLIISVVFMFALTAGARVSSMRAAVMIALYLLGDFFDRDPDAPTALSIAALLFTFHEPRIVYDVGFILSFLSIASILIYRAPIAEGLQRLPGALREGLATSLSVQILPLPAAASFFNVVPFAGPLANLVVVPLLSVVLWLAMLASVTAFVYEPLARIPGHAIYPLVWLIEASARFAAAPGFTSADVPRPTSLAIVAWAVFGWIVYRLLRAKARGPWLIAGVIALVAVVGLWNARIPNSEIVFLDVGQGDATVVRTSAGATMVVDAGDRIGSVDYGQRVVAPYLHAHGVRRIHALVGTHPDNDHLGGIDYLLRHFTVDTLYLTKHDTGQATEAALVELAQLQGTEVRRIGGGDSLPLPGSTIEVLGPPANRGSTLSDNDRSIILRVTLEGRTVLLTADAERIAEQHVARQDCQALILKVPHHGSRTSSHPELLDAVAPEYAVVSTGRKGRKRILSQVILDSYRDRGISLHRTDHAGGVRFVFDEAHLHVETARGSRGFPYPGSVTAP